MSTQYEAQLLVGVPIDAVVTITVQRENKQRYDEETGRPYDVPIIARQTVRFGTGIVADSTSGKPGELRETEPKDWAEAVARWMDDELRRRHPEWSYDERGRFQVYNAHGQYYVAYCVADARDDRVVVTDQAIARGREAIMHFCKESDIDLDAAKITMHLRLHVS